MLAPWKKSYDQPRQHIKKQRHYLTNKGQSNQSYGFSSIMYGCESFTIKKVEHRRIDAFELWCWRRLLRIPWTARSSNQSILKEINPEDSLEGLMLTLKLQYFGHIIQRTVSLKRPWCWERLKVGGEGYDRGWDGWRASLTRWTWVWGSSRCRWWTGKPGVLQSWVTKSLTQVGYWTEPKTYNLMFWCTCALWRNYHIKPVNISRSSHSYLVCVYVWKCHF